jgi:hypothetical protein
MEKEKVILFATRGSALLSRPYFGLKKAPHCWQEMKDLASGIKKY